MKSFAIVGDVEVAPLPRRLVLAEVQEFVVTDSEDLVADDLRRWGLDRPLGPLHEPEVQHTSRPKVDNIECPDAKGVEEVGSG